MNSLAGRAEQVLQRSWKERKAGKTFSVVGVHVVVAAAFLSVGGALAILGPWQRPLDWPLALGLVAAYTVGGRVLIAVGAGYAVPTQLALVPMLVLLPPIVVPLLVAAALVAAAFVDEVLRKRRLSWRAVLAAVGDAPYALAPALVFAALGAPTDGAGLLVACLLAAPAQCLLDYAISAGRERAIRGLAPQHQLAVMAVVWGVDLLLWPVGVVIAGSIMREGWSVLALLPMFTLLHLLARERDKRLHEAQARLEDLEAERSRLNNAVRRVGEAFATGQDLDAVLATTLRTAADATGAAEGRLVIMRPGREPRGVALGASDAVARTRVLGVPGGPPGPPVTAFTHRGGDGVEVRAELAGTAERLSDVQVSLVRFLAEQALVAEGQIERTRRVHELAQTDALTGLANFRRLHEVLDLAVEAFHRHGRPLSLILLDLDHFKAINDRFGHQAGDVVLQSVAMRLRDNARTADVAVRHGGEELALVLPDTGVEGALEVAARTADAIRAHEIVVSARDAVRVTASFGVATLGLHASGKTELIRAADAALYDAKRGGRDRVCAPGAASLSGAA